MKYLWTLFLVLTTWNHFCLLSSWVSGCKILHSVKAFLLVMPQKRWESFHIFFKLFSAYLTSKYKVGLYFALISRKLYHDYIKRPELSSKMISLVSVGNDQKWSKISVYSLRKCSSQATEEAETRHIESLPLVEFPMMKSEVKQTVESPMMTAEVKQTDKSVMMKEARSQSARLAKEYLSTMDKNCIQRSFCLQGQENSIGESVE